MELIDSITNEHVLELALKDRNQVSEMIEIGYHLLEQFDSDELVFDDIVSSQLTDSDMNDKLVFMTKLGFQEYYLGFHLDAHPVFQVDMKNYDNHEIPMDLKEELINVFRGNLKSLLICKYYAEDWGYIKFNSEIKKTISMIDHRIELIKYMEDKTNLDVKGLRTFNTTVNFKNKDLSLVNKSSIFKNKELIIVNNKSITFKKSLIWATNYLPKSASKNERIKNVLFDCCEPPMCRYCGTVKMKFCENLNMYHVICQGCLDELNTSTGRFDAKYADYYETSTECPDCGHETIVPAKLKGTPPEYIQGGQVQGLGGPILPKRPSITLPEPGAPNKYYYTINKPTAPSFVAPPQLAPVVDPPTKKYATLTQQDVREIFSQCTGTLN